MSGDKPKTDQDGKGGCLYSSFILNDRGEIRINPRSKKSSIDLDYGLIANLGIRGFKEKQLCNLGALENEESVASPFHATRLAEYISTVGHLSASQRRRTCSSLGSQDRCYKEQDINVGGGISGTGW